MCPRVGSGFAEGALTSEWPAIVGTEIAARCRPERLTFGHAAERRDGTLTLRVEGAFSTELQLLAPQIIERINGYYGYRAVVRLRLHQGAPAERAAPTTPGPALAPEQEAALEHRLNEVEDPDLRTALGRLGRAVARRTQT